MSASVIQEIRRKLPIRSKSASTAPKTDAPTHEPDTANQVYELPINDIIPNRNQPRSCFNQNAILRLSDSIRRYGILQPLTVRKMLLPAAGAAHLAYLSHMNEDSIAMAHQNNAGATYLPPSVGPGSFSGTQATATDAHIVLYELIAGERRLRAAKLAGLASVPCIIVNTDDSTSAELAIIENLLREDLNMFEQAEAFRRLIDEFMLTQEEVARRVSLSQSAVANKLRILRLTRFERQEILQAGLTERHARALLKLSDESVRLQALGYIIEKKLNVSSSEAYIDKILDEIAAKERKSASGSRETQAVAALTAITARDHEQQGTRKGAIRDIRLFYNSIRNAASILEQTGLRVELSQQEQGEDVLICAKVTHSIDV